MKTYILITILVLTIKIGTSQNWHWAKQIGSNQFEAGIAKIDANNNIFLYGAYYNSCYFQTDTLYSNGVNDFFFAKYDSDGSELWVKGFGGDNPYEPNTNSYDESTSFEHIIDNSNNCIYVAGMFRNQLTIDTFTINSIGTRDYFLAKFDLNGNCLMLKKAGSTDNDSYPTPIEIDNLGNVNWAITFEHSGFIDSINVSRGTHIIKIDSDGNILNIKKLLDGAYLNKVTIYNNETYICGSFISTTLIIGNDTILHNNQAFLAKINFDGSLKWIKKLGRGWNNTFANSLYVDSYANTFLLGQVEDTLIIDTSTVAYNSNQDMYLCKFDSIGNLQWVRKSNADGIYGANGYRFLKSSDSSFYICGYFNGNALFGNYNVSTTNIYEGFVAKYNLNGDCEGVFNFGYARAYGLDMNSNGELLVSGDFRYTVNFGNTNLSSYDNSPDVFFAKCDAITTVGKAKNTAINNQLVIYANPMQGKCNITVPEEFANEKELNLIIMDNSGKQLQNAKLVMIDNKVKIDLNNEAKGIYNVVLSNGKTNYNGKIVFE